MAGRKRKPVTLKLVTGNPGKRALNKKEPRTKKGIPPAPAWMSSKAKEAWPKVAKLLIEMGVLTVSDGIALEALCEGYADLLAARASLNKPVYVESTTLDGKPVKHEVAKAGEVTYVTVGKGGPMIRNRPELAIIADAERRLKSSLAEFGLTPASRSKIQVNDAGEKDDKEERYF